MAQRMKEDVVDTFRNQVACLHKWSLSEVSVLEYLNISSTGELHTRARLDHAIPFRNMLSNITMYTLIPQERPISQNPKSRHTQLLDMERMRSR